MAEKPKQSSGQTVQIQYAWYTCLSGGILQDSVVPVDRFTQIAIA